MAQLFVLAAGGFTEVRPGLIFWTLVTFILVAFLLRKVAWGPILSLVAERERTIEESLESAKRERAEAEKLLDEQKSAIAAARQESAALLAQNKADMEGFRTRIMGEARKQADEELVTARKQIQEEKLRAMNEVKVMAVDLALQAAEKLLDERLDEAKHRKLAEQFVQQLPSGGPSKVRQAAS